MLRFAHARLSSTLGQIRPGRVTIAAALGAAALSSFWSSPAAAQAAGCADVQKYLLQRKTIAASLQPKKGQKMDARFACTNFGKLVANGSSLIKWVDTNKDWCQIPDSFVTSIKEDHGRAINIRGQACGVAAKQNEMEKRARAAAAAGGGGDGQSGGLLGGGGLEGPTRLPQGAL